VWYVNHQFWPSLGRKLHAIVFCQASPRPPCFLSTSTRDQINWVQIIVTVCLSACLPVCTAASKCEKKKGDVGVKRRKILKKTDWRVEKNCVYLSLCVRVCYGFRLSGSMRAYDCVCWMKWENTTSSLPGECTCEENEWLCVCASFCARACVCTQLQFGFEKVQESDHFLYVGINSCEVRQPRMNNNLHIVKEPFESISVSMSLWAGVYVTYSYGVWIIFREQSRSWCIKCSTEQKDVH